MEWDGHAVFADGYGAAARTPNPSSSTSGGTSGGVGPTPAYSQYRQQERASLDDRAHMPGALRENLISLQDDQQILHDPCGLGGEAAEALSSKAMHSRCPFNLGAWQVIPTSDQLREIVLDALEQFYCPMAHQDLVAYVRVFHEVVLFREDLRMLIGEERRGHEAGEQRPVWICPAILNYPGFPADDTLLTRSDWQLATRVVAAAGSEAVRQVWLTRRLCELTSIALEQAHPSAEVLVEAAAAHAELLLPQGTVRASLSRQRGGCGRAPIQRA